MYNNYISDFLLNDILELDFSLNVAIEKREAHVQMELYFGGTIYTMQAEGDVVEAVLVNNGLIQQVGTYEALAPLASTFIDLQQATMLPGLVDSHIHLIGVGEQMSRVQLGDATSKDEIIARLTEAAKKLAQREWLIAEGWNEFMLPDEEMLTLAELDTITRNPVLLHRVCHHVALVNSTVLNMAGITKAHKPMQGGTIGRDAQGECNGFLYEGAVQIATALLPTEGEAYVTHLQHSVERAIRYLHTVGVVGAHSEDCAYYGHYRNVIEAYERTIGKKQHFRVHLLRHHDVFDDMVHASLQPLPGFIEFGAMKIFADGSFGGSTAALLAPYEGTTHHGLLIHERSQFEALVQLARQHEEAIAVHMIGDAAAELVVQMIERYPTPIGKRDRLIHACLVNEQLIERMKKLNVIIDIQPAFVSSDYPWIEQKLGKKRMRYAYAWKTLSMLPCAIGTDAPIEHVHPFHTIAAAVRRHEYGTNAYDESLSVFEALRMYTVGSAYAIGKEHERGLIATGYTADFTVIDRDILHIPTSEIEAIHVLQTIVNGQTVYKKERSQLFEARTNK